MMIMMTMIRVEENGPHQRRQTSDMRHRSVVLASIPYLGLGDEDDDDHDYDDDDDDGGNTNHHSVVLASTPYLGLRHLIAMMRMMMITIVMIMIMTK